MQKKCVGGYKRRVIQINCESGLKGYKKGDRVTINTTKTGVPVELYWRRRLDDAQTDKCIEFVDDNKEKIKEKVEIDGCDN